MAGIIIKKQNYHQNIQISKYSVRIRVYVVPIFSKSWDGARVVNNEWVILNAYG